MEAVALGFVALFVLLLFQVPIGFGMAIVGTAGFAYMIGLSPAMRSIGNTFTDMAMVYDFSVLPLFILMGNLPVRASATTSTRPPTAGSATAAAGWRRRGALRSA